MHSYKMSKKNIFLKQIMLLNVVEEALNGCRRQFSQPAFSIHTNSTVMTQAESTRIFCFFLLSIPEKVRKTSNNRTNAKNFSTVQLAFGHSTNTRNSSGVQPTQLLLTTPTTFNCKTCKNNMAADGV